MAKKKKVRPTTIENRRARHEYHIGDVYQAGIALVGTEVKAIRSGKAQISEGFVRVERGNPVLFNSQIEEYDFGNLNNHTPKRPRRLLLKRKEIDRIEGEIRSGGKTVIPLKMYFSEGLVKVDIAVVTGKKNYDKREDLKKKTQMREAQRDVNAHRMR
ncbi:MAG: SsrA-binding protein SmpB [Puniceicoccaceae bacterium]